MIHTELSHLATLVPYIATLKVTFIDPYVETQKDKYSRTFVGMFSY